MEIVFANSSSISTITSISNKIGKMIKTVISFDDEFQKEEGIQMMNFKELIVAGSKLQPQLPKPDLECIAQICYTSGTTQLPKGVVQTHKMMATEIFAVQ